MSLIPCFSGSLAAGALVLPSIFPKRLKHCRQRKNFILWMKSPKMRQRNARFLSQHLGVLAGTSVWLAQFVEARSNDCQHGRCPGWRLPAACLAAGSEAVELEARRWLTDGL